ncbi:MAG: hypothetical protein MUF31_15440 [Akkermansiaceae bacterium]|jgi:hypothetical protein|nr:hypothetical protein [Akkermansiaceae bacterium]
MHTLLIIAFFVGFALGVGSMWAEARAQYRRGHREGYDDCEDTYCTQIKDTIRQVRVECGLPPEPPSAPSMPAALKEDLVSKWNRRLSQPHEADDLAGDFH